MKTCLECGEKLLGREDKKYCNDACRCSYHNKINKDSTCFMRNINNKLRRNYRILADLNTSGKTNSSSMELLEKGFDFSYFTNLTITKKGRRYYFLYDQGYTFSKDQRCKIVRKQISPPANTLPQ